MPETCSECGEKYYPYGGDPAPYDSLCFRCATRGIKWAAKMARSGAVQLTDKQEQKCIVDADGFMYWTPTSEYQRGFADARERAWNIAMNYRPDPLYAVEDGQRYAKAIIAQIIKDMKPGEGKA